MLGPQHLFRTGLTGWVKKYSSSSATKAQKNDKYFKPLGKKEESITFSFIQILKRLLMLRKRKMDTAEDMV